jgi:hypothetical protein
MVNETVQQIDSQAVQQVNVGYTKSKKVVNLKEVPKYQTDDTPKTKRRYMYEKTGNYVCYARAKQLGII